jgi:hypothetical protein
MAKKLTVINQLRPRIVSQGLADLETLAGRVAKNTTYNPDEIYGMLRLWVREIVAALQAGETVKLDGLLIISANMKVGGAVNLSVRGDPQGLSALSNRRLWTATKIANHANLGKSAEQLIEEWNLAHPDDPVTD